jgi:hypothetical protein
VEVIFITCGKLYCVKYTLYVGSVCGFYVNWNTPVKHYAQVYNISRYDLLPSLIELGNSILFQYIGCIL